MSKYRVYFTPDWYITIEATYVYVGSVISFHKRIDESTVLTVGAFLPEKIVGFCIEEKDA